MTSGLRFCLTLALTGTLLLGCARSSPGAVQAGSMARFIAHDGFLYALDAHELKVYEAASSGSPEHVRTIELTMTAETLYPYQRMLFVGTREGMLVYGLNDPSDPELIGKAQHVFSCDPVVVENDIAYVTLRSAGCNQGVDALIVFDVKDPTKPKELAKRTLASPHGLDIDGSALFVADKQDGLLVFDVRDPSKPSLLATVPNVAGYDVIARAGILFVSADDGLYQYRYGPEGTLAEKPLSRIPIGPPARSVLTPR